jgi:16S rRNA (guanine966-N2)-methyltransferase
MSIRVTGGRFRGKNIPSPPRSKPIRPTSSLLRESIFNRFQNRLEDSRFLDAFAGSGIMSLEALSRGASFALALELENRQCKQIRANFEEFGLDRSQTMTVCTDTTAHLGRPCAEEPFDFIFLDPPYGFKNLESLIASCQSNGWLKPDGILLVEHGRRDPDLPGFIRRDYGDSSISYRLNNNED